MIELAVAVGWTLEELERLDDVQLATMIDVLERRARRG
jgi:hypothetical protein